MNIKFFFLALLLLSCTNHDLGYKFAAGHVIVGFEPDVTIEQAADFANKYAEGIGHLFGFFYYSNLPNDSLKYVTKIITSSIQLATVRIGFQSNRIEILKNFYDPVDSLTLTKWIQVIETPALKLEGMNQKKSMLLFIPDLKSSG